MNPRTWVLLALSLLAAACATDGAPSLKADPSDTGSRLAVVAESRPLQVTRSPIRRAPVEVSKAEYHAAMVQLAKQLRNTLPPRAASQLAIISWGSPGQPD